MKIKVERTMKTVMKPVEVKEKMIVLTLTEGEAEVLVAICNRISGDNKGARGMFSDGQTSILAELSNRGIRESETVEAMGSISLTGNIRS